MADDEPRTGELTTQYFGWVKPTVGSSTDAWGGYINANLDGIDSVVHGIQTSIPTVPAASATPPVMDGLANAGASAAWARGDHAHPTDTSLYPASNPSGYQTAGQVTASLGGYLPLAGGTLTGALTPSSTLGIVGTKTNDNAVAGSVGQVISSNVVSPGVTLTNGNDKTITSISLTAGDWDVSGEAWISFSVTGVNSAYGAVGPTNNTIPGNPAVNVSTAQLANVSMKGMTFSLRPCCVSLAATTTYYLIGSAFFGSGTCNGYGNIIARRVR